AFLGLIDPEQITFASDGPHLNGSHGMAGGTPSLEELAWLL
ncbi:unnamed protein product, partial [marine sediment metagenome]